MTSKQVIWGAFAASTLFVGLPAGKSALAQEKNESRGNVGVLPIGPRASPEPSTDEIVGLTTVVIANLERAVERLADGDVKEFVIGWTSTQKAYAILADSVAEGTAQLAAAEARLEIARERFAQSPSESGPSTFQVDQAAKALEDGEKAVIKAMSDLRTAYPSATGEAKEIILAQMQEMASQAETLRAMRQELARGQSSSGLEAEMTAKMQASLKEVEAGLSVRRQFLHAMGASCAAMLAQSRSQVQTALKVLRLKESMPTQQIERMEQLQASMRRVQSIISDQRKIQDEKLRQVLGGPKPPARTPEEEKDILQKVDALLGIKSTSAPLAN